MYVLVLNGVYTVLRQNGRRNKVYLIKGFLY